MKHLLITICAIFNTLISCNNKHEIKAQKDVVLIEANSIFTTLNPTSWDVPERYPEKVWTIQYGWISYYSQVSNDSVWFIGDTSGPGMGSNSFATESDTVTFNEVMGE